jgi:hypothetical protein
MYTILATILEIILISFMILGYIIIAPIDFLWRKIRERPSHIEKN